MTDTVGVGELRRNLSRYLRRVERGERLVVTDRNRPVAELGPPATITSTHNVADATTASDSSGRCRTRTCDHLRVKQALYQLS